ncbi:unnamed protein product [Adineta steineri]|uniref:Uncharacterized protein n=1 Tax=Adineta steineri TaxID=433720 RepID=A0A818KAT0_9BILA|nr:unnamed protein product [Adineta steineri]CAF3556882.1 unnamed protein product [Adineta steineri]
MATNLSISRKSFKRSVSITEREQSTTNKSFSGVVEWSNDQEIISPYAIHTQAIGLLFCLITKYLINIPFTTLYHRSLKISWLDLLKRDRRNLKSNIHSVEKCFMINRLVAECAKDRYKFAQQTGELYEEIKRCMSSTLSVSTLSLDDFYSQVQTWRVLQCKRRLFHTTHNEDSRPQSLLALQKAASRLYSQILERYRVNPTIENVNHLKQLLQHCFIIVTQPSIPECVAATKYEKTRNTYTAKLFARIICLLDIDTVNNHLTLSSAGVRLYPFDRNLDTIGEEQLILDWHEKTIMDAEEQIKSVLFVQLESIELKKLDTRNARPLYSAKLCQLHFQINIKINDLNLEETFTSLSQPFGLCSHAQYYPEFVAKVLLHEIEQIVQPNGFAIQPDTVIDYIERYYIRISGVQMKHHTSQYILRNLQTVYDRRKSNQNVISHDIYESLLAQIISQMEMFIDHPFLSMMYHDGLFLGICDSALDQQLNGTREEPHILLRFNSLLTHQPTQHASVRFIVHNGQLTRATFHTKAFIDEICRMICESNSNRAKKIRVLSETSDHNFCEFNEYFSDELFRLHTPASPLKDTYQPFIPVLWNTMKSSVDPAEQQLNSPSMNLETIPMELSEASTASMNEIQIDLSNAVTTSDQPRESNRKITIQTDMLVHHIVEKLSDLLIQSSKDGFSIPIHMSRASTLLSTVTEGNRNQQKQLLSHLIYDYFQSQTYIEVSTQTSTPTSEKSPASIVDDT